MPAPPPFEPLFDPNGNPYGNIEEIMQFNKEMDLLSRTNAEKQMRDGFAISLTQDVDYEREKLPDDIMMLRSSVYEPIVVATNVNTEEPKVETVLGNSLTNSQKWAWVIGLTFAAWAVIYWTNKKSN